MKEYKEFNTTQRAKSQHRVRKELFKLLDNSVFEKTMGNLRKLVMVSLVTSELRHLKLASQSIYVRRIIVNEGLVSVQRTRGEVAFEQTYTLWDGDT